MTTRLGEDYVFDLPARESHGTEKKGLFKNMTEATQVEHEATVRARQQAAVAEIGQRALAGCELAVLMNETVALVAKTLDVEFCKVLELLPDGNALLLRAGVGWRNGCIGHATVAAGVESQAGYTLASSEPVVVDDLRTEKRFPGPPLLHDHGVTSGVSVIIHGRGRPFGVLGAHTVHRRRFTGDDVHFLQAIANVIAAAVERKQAEEHIQRQVQRLAALRSVDMAISSTLDLRVTLNVFLDHVTTQLKVDAADVLLLSPRTQLLEYAAGRGFRTKSIEASRLRLGEGHAGRVALERRIVTIPNLPKVSPPFKRALLIADEAFVTYYGVPLMVKGYAKGVLEIFNRSRLEPDREWVEFLEALAGQAAIAVDNVTLFDELQRSNAELALAYDTTLEGWVRALDLRDKEVEGHSQRVVQMTAGLARAMGVRDDELVHVRRGALLHDIGKIAISDSILLKPGPLSDEEWKVIRRHPMYAYDLLSPIPYLREALDIPCCHHEKWDGTGYPRGLKGEQIPMAARVFAVVDTWDALRSDRPYRPAWPEQNVREYIRSQAKTHFDPNVVDAFFKMGGF